MADGGREGGNRYPGRAGCRGTGSTQQYLRPAAVAGGLCWAPLGGRAGIKPALEVPSPYSSSSRYKHSEFTGVSPAAATGRYAAVPVTHAAALAFGRYSQVLACSNLRANAAKPFEALQNSRRHTPGQAGPRQGHRQGIDRAPDGWRPSTRRYPPGARGLGTFSTATWASSHEVQVRAPVLAERGQTP